MLIDAQLMFWIAATLALAHVWWRRWNEHVDAEAEHAERVQRLTLTGSATGSTLPAATVAPNASAAAATTTSAASTGSAVQADAAASTQPPTRLAASSASSSSSCAQQQGDEDENEHDDAAAAKPTGTGTGKEKHASGKGGKGKKQGKKGGKKGTSAAAASGGGKKGGSDHAQAAGTSGADIAELDGDEEDAEAQNASTTFSAASAPYPASTSGAIAKPASAPAAEETPKATAATTMSSDAPSAHAPPPGSRVFVSQQALASLDEAWHADRRYMDEWTRLAWVLAIGIVCANAVSVKFTGLAAPGMVAVESFFALFVVKRAYPLRDLILIAIVVVLVFAGYYKLHFDLLPLSGDGDEFMPPEFKATLIGNPLYNAAAPKPGFWDMLVYLNIDMVRASDGIVERHNWDSVWWEWIVNKRGVLYYSVDRFHTYTEGVYLLGNPMVIWGLVGFLGIAALLLLLFLRLRTDVANGFWAAHGTFYCSITFCLIVYALNLLPYVAVKRSTFIYHYMPAMMAAQIMSGLIVDRLTPSYMKPGVVKILLVVVIGCYLYYAPWVYGLPLTNEAHARRRWLPRWD